MKLKLIFNKKSKVLNLNFFLVGLLLLFALLPFGMSDSGIVINAYDAEGNLLGQMDGDGNNVLSINKLDKEFNKDKYQRIETENVIFELPKYATHYWMPEGLDKYEVIVSNFSIKDNSDYILRVTWYDERYIDETLQIHYSFKNKKLKKQDIDIIPLSDYNRDCLMGLTTSNKEKKDCEKEIKKSKLKLNDVDIEIGMLEGYESRAEQNISCLDLTR